MPRGPSSASFRVTPSPSPAPSLNYDSLFSPPPVYNTPPPPLPVRGYDSPLRAVAVRHSGHQGHAVRTSVRGGSASRVEREPTPLFLPSSQDEFGWGPPTPTWPFSQGDWEDLQRGLGEDRDRGGGVRVGGEEMVDRRGRGSVSDAPVEVVDDTRPGFRLTCTKYLLTYSQVGDLDPDLFRGLMETFSIRPKWHLVRETHADGGKHWHCVVVFQGKPPASRRGARLFDIEGVHPNIAPIKTRADLLRVWAYINKEEGALHLGDFEGPGSIEDKGSKKENWAFIHAADTAEEFEDRAKTLDAFQWCNNYTRLKEYMNARYKPAVPEYVPKYTEFPGVTGEMVEWVEGEMKKEDRPKALVIYGPSRTGKTEWARSLGNHVYMGNLFNTDDFREDKDYIVLDDINAEFFPNYKSWFGAQRSFVITDKYRSKKTVRWGKPMIWLSNNDPRHTKGWDREWLEANAVFIHLEHKLYEPLEAPMVDPPSDVTPLRPPTQEDAEYWGIMDNGPGVVYYSDLY